MLRFRLLVLTSILLTAVTSGAIAEAAPLPAAAKSYDERLAELEQEIAILKRLRENEQEVVTKKAQEAPIVSFGKKGLVIETPDKNFTFKLGGYSQIDGRFFAGGNADPIADQFLLRRIRFDAGGTVAKHFDYRILYDLANNTTALQDAYIDFKYFPAAKLRVGKFKAPVSLDRLQSITASPFIELGYTTAIAPNRDTGVQLFGELLGGSVEYAAGIFNGTVDGSNAETDNNDGKDIIGRVFVRPFKNTEFWSLQDLGLGFAASHGNQSGTLASPNLPSFRSEGQQSFFSYRSTGVQTTTTIADGSRTRLAPQAAFYYGPFGFLTEYVSSNQEVSRNGIQDILKSRAWQALLSYVLTGEKASYKGVEPAKPFDPSKRDWGALELAGRYHQIALDKNAFPFYADPARAARGADSWTLGLNWYLNKNLRYQLNFERTAFNDTNGALKRENEYGILNRFQVQF